MPSHRTDRLNKDMRQELAALLRDMKDPRIDEFLSVMRVEVTSDLSYATVHIGSVKGAQAATDACAVLKKAAGYLRTEIAKRMRIRKAPELRFVPDSSAEYYNKIDNIIKGFDNGNE